MSDAARQRGKGTSIVFCMPSISGYMAACWREMASRTGVQLFVIGMRRAPGKHSDFHASVMEGIPHHLLHTEERSDYRRIRELVLAQEPDVIHLAGWQHKPYIRLAFDPALRGVRLFLGLDNPLRDGVRQRIGRFALRLYLRRMERVLVPGERSWQYARWLGVPESEIHRGIYGIDWTGLSPLWESRAASAQSWPRRFLFTGQYLRRKGVDLLTEAYARYREHVDGPWPLSVAGGGPEKWRLQGAGIVDHGFLQPSDLSDLRERSGVFVLPSRSDAWPLALVEACAAGLPIIATPACGSSVELLRSYHNGLMVPTGNAVALSNAMIWIHRNRTRLRAMGFASRELAAAYSAERWADRYLAVVRGDPPS